MTPVSAAFYASLFTYAATAAGAALVFFFAKTKQSVMDAMAGFAAGVMIAASFFSLLMPAIDFAEESGVPPWIAVTSGFLAGCLLLYIADRAVPHLHPQTERTEGAQTGMRRSSLMMLAMTIHNIPEGMAVGVAFGAAASGGEGQMAAALALAVGMGIQNFPEGAAAALPMRAEGASRGRAFLWGQFSGFVEIPFAVLGAVLVSYIKPILPFMLSLAAGSMIYVVVDELIPEAHMDGKKPLVTSMLVLGLLVMMGLDVGLG